MSPLSLRRYRAERLLRREFEAMRTRVIAHVCARLRAAGVSLDADDLEACYAAAWQGLYATMLAADGAEVANPEGWLTLVAYRRALDEHRARVRAGAGASPSSAYRAQEAAFDPSAPQRDLAEELDDRIRLRQLMEGLRVRLSPREREAATLCYLQGLSRAQAAAQLRISPARMRKLMDGARPGQPGVAAKVGELLQTISAGSYCTEQDSLMRGFAFGVLDPAGERYGLALAHQRECPACRAHVLSLRGLAAVLPPLPLPLVLGAGALGSAGAGAGVGAAAGAGSTGLGSAPATGGSNIGVGGATGIGAGAGGGWLLAGGGLAGHLAAGCLFAVGLGASCVALSLAPFGSHHATHGSNRSHAHVRIAATTSHDPVGSSIGALSSTVTYDYAAVRPGPAVSSTTRSVSTSASSGASREFGPEQPPRGSATGSTRSADLSARTATSSATSSARAQSEGSLRSTPTTTATPTTAPARPPSSYHEEGAPSAAAREFAPG